MQEFFRQRVIERTTFHQSDLDDEEDDPQNYIFPVEKAIKKLEELYILNKDNEKAGIFPIGERFNCAIAISYFNENGIVEEVIITF